MHASVLAIMFVWFADEVPGPGGVVATGAALEKVWGERTFTEGGALAEDGSILFSGVYVFSPAGEWLALIGVPESPTNVEFGADGHMLYVTAGKSLYRIETTLTGLRPER